MWHLTFDTCPRPTPSSCPITLAELHPTMRKWTVAEGTLTGHNPADIEMLSAVLTSGM